MQQPKPRLNYAAFMAAQRPGTLAWIAERYIATMRQPGARGVSYRLEISYRFLQRGPLGATDPATWTLSQLLEYGRMRKANGVLTNYPGAERKKELNGATVKTDFTNLKVLVGWAIDEEELPLDGALALVKKAARRLKKERVVATAKKRKRRATPEEQAALRAYFTRQNGVRNTQIDMVQVFDFACGAGRRISETCRIQRQHVTLGKVLTAPDGRQFEAGTYWIYDLKNPNGKGVHHEFVLIGRALEVVKERLDVIPDEPDALLFPWNPKSCSQRFIVAKKELGIVDLRLHDSRRLCFSALLAAGFTLTQVQYGWSGHLGDAKTLADNYTDISADEILDAVAARAAALPLVQQAPALVQ